MAKKEHHTLLWLLGLGGAAFAGYEWVYKPWEAQQALLTTPAGTGLDTTGISYGGSTGGGGSGYSVTPAPSYATTPVATYANGSSTPASPSPLTYVTSPANITPTPQNYVNTGGPSNLSPGNAVGGLIGACMNKKGWTQSVCTTKLRAILAAYQDAVAQLQNLQSGGIAGQLQTQLAANQSAAANALQSANAAKAGGNAGSFQAFMSQYNENVANTKSIQSQIAAIPQRITAYTSAIAGYITEFQNATGADIRTVAAV